MRRFPLDAALLALLACPVCETHPGLELAVDEQHLACPLCRRIYEIDENGIPDLDVPERLVAEA